MNRLRILLSCSLILISVICFAGGNTPIKNKNIKGKEDKSLLLEADNSFKFGSHTSALYAYQKLLEKYPDELLLKYKIGICYLKQSDEYANAENYLKQVYETRPNTTDLSFYLGTALHYNLKFDEAILFLNQHLKESPSNERKKQVVRLIENCNNGKELMENPIEAKIYNLGLPVNTNEDEYVPVISSDESVLIFTYRGNKSTGGLMDESLNSDFQFGQYFEDVFISHKVEEIWSEPVSIGTNINGTNHDASIAISNDGQKLFIYRHTKKDKGDLFVSNLVGEVWSEPERLKGNINSKDWEGSASLSSDEKLIYFSSERPGGYGGKDLYTAEISKKGTWDNIKNMGPTINTSFDEDAPFIHPDGTILHFSSKGHNSMGGFDIFVSEINKEQRWSKPQNLGYPINTADDDIFYVLTADGKRGYYASGKPGGMGKKDIYVVEPGLLLKKTVLMLVKGNVTIDDEPMYAEIMVASGMKEKGTYHSNEISGKYLVNLPAGLIYTITYKVEGFEPKSETINTTYLDSFIEKVIDVKFYTEDFVAKLPVSDTETIIETITEVETETKQIVETETIAIVNSEVMTFDQILEKYGNIVTDGLIYKVQIGAYRMPENFVYKHLVEFGKVETLMLEDKIERFTLGNFSTLKEADMLKMKIIAKGGLTTDSFVTAIYNGKRIFLEDLIKVNFKP